MNGPAMQLRETSLDSAAVTVAGCCRADGKLWANKAFDRTAETNVCPIAKIREEERNKLLVRVMCKLLCKCLGVNNRSVWLAVGHGHLSGLLHHRVPLQRCEGPCRRSSNVCNGTSVLYIF